MNENEPELCIRSYPNHVSLGGKLGTLMDCYPIGRVSSGYFRIDPHIPGFKAGTKIIVQTQLRRFLGEPFMSTYCGFTYVDTSTGGLGGLSKTKDFVPLFSW